jgi:3-hydroxyisobutyrate dehydrogenase-like beta-hydroxyacid dehydrogenase
MQGTKETSVAKSDRREDGQGGAAEHPVGVIGLGIMGGAMARSLARGGWRVIGYDIDAACAAAAEREGIEIASSAPAAAQAAPVLITSLPTAEAVLATAEAIAGTVRPKRIVIETSTLALEDKLQFAAALQAKSHVPLDCPLSGTGAQARTKDLVILASGEPATIADLQPLFLGFGRRVFDLGAFGNGTKMKFIANHLVAIHNVATAEAMVLGMKAGLDLHQIVDVIGSGAGTSRIFELRAPMMADNRYEPATMRCSIWQKDMRVIGAFAKELACPTPLFNATEAIYSAGLSLGHAGLDTAAVCRVLEAMAGISR